MGPHGIAPGTVGRRELLGVALAAATPFVTASATMPNSTLASTVLPLWPGPSPGGENVTVTQSEVVRSDDHRFRDVAIVHTTSPTLTMFRPEKPNGASIILVPGGSYQRVVVGKEGSDIARWLVERGITAFVLLYRLPADGWSAGPDAPLQDAQRAVRLVRGQAGTLGLDPARVAVMGFSAGGHLVARLGTRYDLRTYAPVDAADELPARPDLTALGYPVITLQDSFAHLGSRQNMLGPDPDMARITAYSAESGVLPGAPPFFIMAAADDTTVPVENSLLMFQALRKAKVSASLHLFESGGHGFALRAPPDQAVAAWPQHFLEWSRQHRFV